MIMMLAVLQRSQKKNAINAVKVLLKLKKNAQFKGKGLFFLSRLINMGSYPMRAQSSIVWVEISPAMTSQKTIFELMRIKQIDLTVSRTKKMKNNSREAG